MEHKENRDKELENLLCEWLTLVDDALADNPLEHDAYVRIGAKWEKGKYRERFREAMSS